MSTVDIDEAQDKLSQLLDALQSGVEKEIVLTRNGQPVVRLLPFEEPKSGVRLGVAKGQFAMPDDWDADNEEIAKMFYGEDE